MGNPKHLLPSSFGETEGEMEFKHDMYVLVKTVVQETCT